MYTDNTQPIEITNLYYAVISSQQQAIVEETECLLRIRRGESSIGLEMRPLRPESWEAYLTSPTGTGGKPISSTDGLELSESRS